MTDPVPAAPAAGATATAYRSDRFVAHVHTLCESKQARAALRRGLGLPVERCTQMHRYLMPWLRDNGDPRRADVRRAYYAVASLIAARPRLARDTSPHSDATVPWYERERDNLGASLGRAVAAGVLKANSAESALHLMARQSSDSIHQGLPALVRQLLGGGITVDWVVLLVDLSRWNRDRDAVATRWLESYFRTADGTTQPDLSDADEENHR